MVYEELVGRLAEPSPPLDVAAFPDGSIDSYYRVRDGERKLSSREAFADALLAGRGSLQLTNPRRFPGGQTVNMAQQVAALDDDIHLAGYLDDPIFDSLPFETSSMGPPADVTVLQFDDDDLMLAAHLPDTREWEFEQLQAVVDPESFLDVDLVCCGNAGIFADVGDVATRVAAAGSGGVVVCDTGEVSGWAADSRRSLVDTMAAFEESYRTIVSGNRSEIESLASSLPGESDDGIAALAEQIRKRAGITGVVAHMDRRAVAATPEGPVAVPNLDTERVVTVTGAGDRFTAGLGHGIAAGWEWKPALQLGNTCASYHVHHGETIPRAKIPAYLDGLATV